MSIKKICAFKLIIIALLAISSACYAASISLSWDQPLSGGSVEDYNVYYGLAYNPSAMDRISGIQRTTYSLENLQDGQTYFFYVSAQNSIGEGPLSDVYSAIALDSSTATNPPTNLRIVMD